MLRALSECAVCPAATTSPARTLCATMGTRARENFENDRQADLDASATAVRALQACVLSWDDWLVSDSGFGEVASGRFAAPLARGHMSALPRPMSWLGLTVAIDSPRSRSPAIEL